VTETEGKPLNDRKSRVRRQQIVNRILLVILVLCGGAAGYSLGRQLVIWQSLLRLDQYSKQALTQNDASLTEARNSLEALKNTGSASCADQEIGYLRDLVFRSTHLKDAGRIRGNKIQCSAITGHSVRSLSSLAPDSSQSVGGFTYYSLKGTSTAAQNRAALQYGNAFVVIDSGGPPGQDADPVKLVVTTSSNKERSAGTTTGRDTKSDDLAMAEDGSGRVGQMLFATRCSSLGFNCVTLSVPAAYVLQSGTAAISASAGIGALIWLFLGMLLLRVRARNMDMPSQLRQALDRNKLDVVYQPIVNLATQMTIGAEALARWTNADGEAVSPEVFVKVAEENGFVGKITRSVLQRILHDFATTLQDRPGFRISMNVAGADLSDPAFLPMLDESLRQANVKPESIVIEITERSTADSVVAMETIRNLRRMGHSIHIDDFGTGYSNLDKLLYLFADTIKIDKAFTRVIGTESLAVTVLPQILNMAKSLQLGVVVEGVETKLQSDYFGPSEQKIHAQGWLYGRPASAEAIKSLLANNLPLISNLETSELASETEDVAARLHLVYSRTA
jgi:sensor c-di-GMP phosphodiesterase-like protein